MKKWLHDIETNLNIMASANSDTGTYNLTYQTIGVTRYKKFFNKFYFHHCNHVLCNIAYTPSQMNNMDGMHHT